MSILLESLNQAKTQDETHVPTIADSHFDDEMLSDEWLLSRVKFWKMTAIALATVLFLVLVTAYLLWPNFSGDTEYSVKQTISIEKTTTPKIVKSQEPTEVQIDLKTETLSKVEEVLTDSQLKSNLNVTANRGSSETSRNPREKYQPKIIKQETTSRAVQNRVKYISSPNQGQTELAITDTPVNFESLSVEEQQRFPELKINSYAVSSNPSKSFVVLNDIFYAQGETIAPHLVLVAIDNNSIILNYKNKLIRKKYAR